MPELDALENERTHFVHISNYRAIKNPLFIAKFVNQLSQIKPLVLHLVGKGRLLARLIDSLALGPNLTLVNHGFMKDITKVITKTDCMLISSHEESFSMAALESLSCGVPVLASSVGGLPELIQGPLAGRLYAPDDLDSALEQYALLQSSLEEIDLEERKAYIMRSVEAYDRQSVIERYLGLYAMLYRDV